MARLHPPEHDCSFPDEACSYCEEATPIEQPLKPLYSGPRGDHTVDPAPAEDEQCVCGTDFTCFAAEHDQVGRPSRPAAPRDAVVNISVRPRCCFKDGCGPGCR